MISAAHSVPQETDDPANKLLDLFETTLSTLADMGLELPMRARFERRFPAPKAQSAETEQALRLAAVLAALRTVDKCRLSDANRALVDVAKRSVGIELEQILAEARHAL